MKGEDAMADFFTHEIVNQVAPLGDYSLFDTDIPLREAVIREGAAQSQPALAEHGTWLGRASTLALGDRANQHSPRLIAYDRNGHRIDSVAFDPAWHLLMEGIISRGLHSAAWTTRAPGAHVARAAGYLMQGQVEAGTLCPTTMTFAAFPLLRDEPAGALSLIADCLTRLKACRYDAADAPIANKSGVLVGMGLTEKQGGSDLRAITSRALPEGVSGRGQAYRVIGHKWFYSVPQSDAHLVLVQSGEGLSCVLVPRWMPDGKRNAVRIRRLKNKLGNRSNASAEVEFENAWGLMLGEPGRGLATLLRMASQTRLDCVLGSAALMRQALVQAIHHASHRQAFGQRLIAHPLMANVLADLALESEAACVLAMRLARAVDESTAAATATAIPSLGVDPRLARALVRIGTPSAKLWVCKRAIAVVAECLEVLGGNGYSEEGPLARLYREAPVNSIWEGSGNVMALDVLRSLADPVTLESLQAEFAPAVGRSPIFDRYWSAWSAQATNVEGTIAAARTIAAGLARLWQAALLIQHAPAFVADAFVASRLEAPESAFGELPLQTGFSVILARAWTEI
jgi:putative acyl-CoA dehydrogenase